MSTLHKNPSRVQLAETNCSFDLQESDKEEKVNLKNRGKKRIGRYSFYLKNLIGSGFSSRVYRGIKDNDKSVHYAIKVIKMKDMNIGNINLLNNEIDIIQKLDHPNLVRFVDVLYTNHHCYLVMQYCEGGNLEKYVKSHDSIAWGNIIHQIIQGCQYLSINNIVHRDLKPANIFRKNGIWKIGDFGFSKRIPNSHSLIIESYKVGSPLFMPLQTLQRNMYSAKSDSFALGVIIYYLIQRQYPWSGSNLQKLVKSYKQKEMDCSKMQLLSLQIIKIIKGLCCMDMKKRLSIQECDSTIFLNQKSINQIQRSLLSLKGVTEQVILCQFINYLLKNSMLFLEDDHVLYSLMSSNIYHLTSLFKWEQNKSLKEIKNGYILPEGNIKIDQTMYRKILKSLESTINILKFRDDSSLCQIGLQKFLEYRQIINCILQANMEKLCSVLKQLILHNSFHDLVPNSKRIKELLSNFTSTQ